MAVTLLSLVLINVLQNYYYWPRLMFIIISITVYAYNTSPSKNVGISPYTALYYRAARIPFKPDLHRASAANYNSYSTITDNQFTLTYQIDSYTRTTLEFRNIKKKAKANESLQRLHTYQTDDIVYLKTPFHSSASAHLIPNSSF